MRRTGSEKMGVGWLVVWALVLFAVLSGCYSTSPVPVAQLASITRPLTAPITVSGNVRLGPRTEVRARFYDGSISGWWPAGRLLISKHGLVVPGARSHNLRLGSADDHGAADGALWGELAGLELHNLDVPQTAAAVIAAPIAMSLMLVAALGTTGAIVNGDDPTPSLVLGAEVATAVGEAAANADAEADPGYAPERMPDGRLAGLLTARRSEDEPAAIPLFSERARRRDDIKFVVAGEGGVSAGGAFTGGLGLGLRLGDFVEMTARVRGVAFDREVLTAVDDALSGAPLPPTTGNSSPAPHLLLGGRLALHIDGDGDPLSAFVLGGEVLAGRVAGGLAVTELGLVLGPRVGIGATMFASLLFTPSVLLIGDASGLVDATAAQFMITAELGFGL